MFESVSKLIQTKLKEKDFKGALSVATKYRDTLTSAGDAMADKEWVTSYSKCVEYVGDCYFGLHNVESALREYEQALSLGAKLYSPTDDPNMLLLFKIEKTIAKIGERMGTTAGLKSADALTDAQTIEEHQRRWRANLLLTAQERMDTTQSNISESRVMRRTHLNIVWQDTVAEVQKRNEQKRATKDLATEVVNLKRDLFQFNRMWLEVGASVIALILTFVVASINVVNCIQKEPVPLNDTEAKMLAENPYTPAYLMERTFTVQGPPEDKIKFEKNEVVVNADLDSFSVPSFIQCKSLMELPGFLFFTATKKCTWLERCAYGLETPNGKVLFDVTLPEYKLANYINEYVGSAAETGEKPEADYTNPYTNTVQSVQFGNVKDQSITDYILKLGGSFELTPGTIICVKEKVREGLNRYYGIAVGREKGLLVPLGLGADLFLSDTDQKQRLLNALGKPQAIIVCDRSTKDALLILFAAITTVCLVISLAPFVHTRPLRTVFKVLSMICIALMALYFINNL